MNHEMQEAFLKEYQAKFSKETIRSYRISLKQFFSFYNKPFDEIKAAEIRTWIASMEGEGLKPKSVELKLTAVKSFYRYCVEENKLKQNPVANVKTPKKNDSLPYYLNRSQLSILQELTLHNLRDRAIVAGLYATGARISELLNIQLSDIKWDNRQIWIRKGKGNKERFVLFTHECAVRFQAYLKDRNVESAYLFCNQKGNPLDQDTVQKAFRSYSKKLEFRVTPHTMRHTFAAHLSERNMPPSYIQDLLGHVNLSSTHIYTRLMEHARKKLYDRFQQ